jgi:anti-sigma factor RsiW
MEHPTDDELAGFALGLAGRAECRTVVRHLLRQCPACAAKIRRWERERPAEPTVYDEALERLAKQLRELEEAPPACRWPRTDLLDFF